MADYIDMEAVHLYGGFETETDDVLLATFITAASRFIDGHCGRVFGVDAETTVTFADDGLNDSPFDGRVLWLDRDLAAKASSHPDHIYLPSSPPYDRIVLTEGRWTNPTEVTGYWGYSVEPDALIQTVCLRLVKWMYSMRETTAFDRPILTPDGQVLMPQGVPADILSLLVPYKRWSIA